MSAPRNLPSKSYKWGLIICDSHNVWRGVAWFKTRKAAEAYSFTNFRHTPTAIARLEYLPS